MSEQHMKDLRAKATLKLELLKTIDEVAKRKGLDTELTDKLIAESLSELLIKRIHKI